LGVPAYSFLGDPVSTATIANMPPGVAALMANYARSDLVFERGEGAYLFDKDGRRYLDFACGIAVTGLGHAHPHVLGALIDQARKVWHVSNLYMIEQQARLAERLTATCFADQAFFCNSGAEALEASIKLARIYFDHIGKPERYRVITFENAFHGRTLATIAAGGQPKHLKGFDPPVQGFDHVPFGDLDATRAAIGPETAAILIEPIQGEGGIRVAPPDFLRGLRALADRHGLLLMFDEVQCGMGRTGRLFAHQWTDIVPDVMALAKALGNGFPIGACLARAKVAAALVPGSHGSTYGGNMLACAVGNAVLDVMLADGFLAEVERLGQLLRARLEAVAAKHPKVYQAVRGLGLMLGVQCVPPARDVMLALRKHGLLTVTAEGNALRLLPPLIIAPAQIEEAGLALERAAAELAR
jgi:acetylornithine/N-succinyldiaminopimelate aminotransferase